MSNKYSPRLIEGITDFTVLLSEELGADYTSETLYNNINAMLDVFDPGIKNAILMHQLSGHSKFKITLVFYESTRHNKVRAIKALRQFSNLGLKEAKELTDSASSTPGVAMTTGISSRRDEYKELSGMLAGTGYRVNIGEYNR
jgi:ribosomal protein L7/L12